MHTVAEVLNSRAIKRTVVTVSRNLFLAPAAKLMQENRVRSLVIKENERPVAIVTEHDLTRAVGEHNGNVANVRVRDVMTKNPFFCTGEHMISDIKAIMSERRFRHVPVVNGQGKLVDLISMGDIINLQVRIAAAHSDRLQEVYTR